VVAALRTVVDVTTAAPKAVAHVVRPVAGAVTSAFGWRQDPFTDKAKFHQGVDLRAAYGQEVHSAAAGRVVFSGEQGGYGTTVLVEHADGTRTRYAHLSARLVEKGEELSAGQTLGRAGRSGRATGTHLHFEVIAPNGQRIAPEQWAGPVLQGRQAAAAAGNSPLVTVERPIQDRTGNAD
jgi:murein DD-endopeptidase MepM/ murein hydrolase activator NlpD